MPDCPLADLFLQEQLEAEEQVLPTQEAAQPQEGTAEEEVEGGVGARRGFTNHPCACRAPTATSAQPILCLPNPPLPPQPRDACALSSLTLLSPAPTQMA